MDRTERRAAGLLARGPRRRHRRAPLAPTETHHFLFAGEAGSCLGGMQDFYGAYASAATAQAAVPPEADWAEIAMVRAASLEVVLTGERRGRSWRWRNLDDEGERQGGAAA